MLKGKPAPLREKMIWLMILPAVFLLAGAVAAWVLHDRVLLTLSLILCGFGIIRACLYYATVSRGEYETVKGKCVSVSPTLFHRQRKVTLEDSDGYERTLFFPKQEKVALGTEYVFYFKKTKSIGAVSQIEKEELPPDCLLGYEKVK